MTIWKLQLFARNGDSATAYCKNQTVIENTVRKSLPTAEVKRLRPGYLLWVCPNGAIIEAMEMPVRTKSFDMFK